VTSVSEKKTSKSISAYPNPAQNQVQFSFDSPVINGTITVINSTGQILSVTKNVYGPSFSFDISDLPAGAYVIRAEDHSQRYSGRFIKH
jgi:hypothetical protein